MAAPPGKPEPPAGKAATPAGPPQPGQRQTTGKPGTPPKSGNAAAPDAPPKGETGESTPLEGVDEQPLVAPPPAPTSRLYRILNALATAGLFATFFGLLGLTVLTMDFLDILQFRYKIPEQYRAKWPLSAYYDFVKLHQMPEEQRFQELVERERRRYQSLISSGSEELQKRSSDLEGAYRNLIRSEEQKYRDLTASQGYQYRDMVASLQATHRDLMRASEEVNRRNAEELRKLQEENLKEAKRLEELRKDLELRKESIDILSRQVASEAVSLETSLIRFMEEENRLRPIQEVAASMDPRALAEIFNEVSENKLIYDILRGVPPERAALVLSFMDPEKAGKIVKMSTIPPTLPSGGRSYVPSSLQNLLASSQANVR